MNKLEAKNTIYNDPMYDVVVDSRMLEQHLKEKDQQISNLEAKLVESEKKLEKNDDEWREICDSKLETINRLIEEKHELQQQLADMTKKYELASLPMGGLVDTARNLEKQLKTQPAEIVEKIRKWGQKHYNWVGDGTGYDGQDYNECIGFNRAIDQLNEALGTILKEYGENNE